MSTLASLRQKEQRSEIIVAERAEASDGAPHCAKEFCSCAAGDADQSAQEPSRCGQSRASLMVVARGKKSPELTLRGGYRAHVRRMRVLSEAECRRAGGRGGVLEVSAAAQLSFVPPPPHLPRLFLF